MKINPISFKGYDAAPLRRIHTDYKFSHPIKEEMYDISSKENFSFAMEFDDDPWCQDTKTIVCKDNQKFIIGCRGIKSPFFETFEKRYSMPHIDTPYFITGGNCYMGKYPDGKNWMLVGRSNLKNPEKIKNTPYNTDSKDVFILPQQNFHLDMYLRPVGYPYVLVNDPEMVCENIEKLGYKPQDICPQKYYRELGRYCKVDETIKKLEEYGFKPIRIAGDYSHGINFMNAIVNKHKDGTVSYITNSSDTEMFKAIQEQFEKDLRNRVSNIDKVYFVTGCDSKPRIYWNYMMNSIENYHGGLHCMTMEEPDFDVWE